MKLLFITGKYPPDIGQSGLIISQIANTLQSRGHKIVCLTKTTKKQKKEKDNIEGVNVIRVYESFWARLKEKVDINKAKKKEQIVYRVLVYLRKLWLAFHISEFPNVEPNITKKMIDIANKLEKEYGFDGVIGVFRPYSTIMVSVAMKKKHPHLVCGTYYLDLVEDRDRPSLMPMKLYKKLCYKGDINAFLSSDFILLPKSSERKYSTETYAPDNSKVTYVDFPAFIPLANKEGYTRLSGGKTLKFLFAGTLDKSFRNPEFMLQILDGLSKRGLEITVNFYGRGNCFDIIDKMAHRVSCEIIQHGVVPHDVIVEKMSETDFLVNISNDYNSIVPSKIFELFATGKPIINFISREDDYSLRYFEKYPLAFTVSKINNIDLNVEALQKFILSSRGKVCDYKTLVNLYRENTPEYLADIIEQNIIKRNDRAYDR
ncbi:MAG: hypothetical protein PHT02_10445 [Tissierellia bacterium]|nr:hypothetical protein [Tissierellia bacterium]